MTSLQKKDLTSYNIKYCNGLSHFIFPQTLQTDGNYSLVAQIALLFL